MAVEMMNLRPFFSYFGSKWTSVPHYPKPMFGRIVEPFAGSACYATRYAQMQVTLTDINPVIAGLWQYLIKVKEHEILSLPTVFDNVDELKGIAQESKNLIGFWLAKGVCEPKIKPSSFVKSDRTWRNRHGSIWGEKVKWRIASSLKYIRHWKVLNEAYEQLDNELATWFVDPPYQNSCGRRYVYNTIDYENLGKWCRSRKGMVIVCEQKGANWLNFSHSHTLPTSKVEKGVRGVSEEISWVALNKPIVTKPVSLWD